MFDDKIDVGIIVTAIAAVAGFSVFAFRLFSEIGKINLKLNLMWEWFMLNHQGPMPNGAVPSTPREFPRPHA